MDAQGVLAARLRDALNALHPPDDVTVEADGGTLFDGGDISRWLWAATPAEVAPAAQAISSQEIGRATLEYLHKHRLMHTSASIAVVRVAMALSAIDGHDADAAYFADVLVQLEPNDFSWLCMLHYPQVHALFASGICAARLGVADASVAALMQAVNSRPKAAAPARTANPSYFCDTLESFTAILAASPLHGREIVELPVLDTPERAYAIRASAKDWEREWRQARALVAKTGRWPVVLPCARGSGNSWREAPFDDDLFSRFEFEQVQNVDDVSPRAIIAAADSAGVQAFLQRMEQWHGEHWRYAESVRSKLEVTQHYCGQIPSQQELANAKVDGQPLTTPHRLEKWLLDWELRHDLSIDLADVRQEWHAYDSVALLFLPSPNPWDALAYISWFGATDYGAENYIALGRSWHKRYGAELFFHSGTEIRCLVTNPPSEVKDAWGLACEHNLAADSTLALPGIAVRHHALGLVDCDRWLLFNQP